MSERFPVRDILEEYDDYFELTPSDADEEFFEALDELIDRIGSENVFGRRDIWNLQVTEVAATELRRVLTRRD